MSGSIHGQLYQRAWLGGGNTPCNLPKHLAFGAGRLFILSTCPGSAPARTLHFLPIDGDSTTLKLLEAWASESGDYCVHCMSAAPKSLAVGLSDSTSCASGGGVKLMITDGAFPWSTTIVPPPTNMNSSLSVYDSGSPSLYCGFGRVVLVLADVLLVGLADADVSRVNSRARPTLKKTVFL